MLDTFSALPLKFRIDIGARNNLPYINAVFQFNKGGASSAQITVEPDPVLFEVLPTTPIQVYVADPLDPQNEVFFWSGFYVGSSGARNKDGSYRILQFVGALGLLGGQTSPAAAMVAQFGAMPIFGGQLISARKDGAFDKILITSYYSKAVNDSKYLKTYLQYEQKPETLGKPSTAATYTPKDVMTEVVKVDQAIITLVDNLYTWNLAAFLSAWRSDFVANTVSLDSTLMSQYLKFSILDKMLDAGSAISLDSSLLEIIQQLLYISGCTITEIPMPTAGDGAPIYLPATNSGLHTNPINRKMMRNLILPEMSYAFPPPCNWIFESTIVSYSDNRSFMTEPTRKLVVLDKSYARGLMLMSPTTKALTEMFKANGFQYKGKDNVFSAFLGQEVEKSDPSQLMFNISMQTTNADKAGNDKSQYRDLKGVMMPLELLKGVVPSYNLSMFNEMLAFAKHTQITDGNAADIKKKNEQNLDFMKLIQSIADYNLSLESRSRSVSLTIKGNIYVVPGMPAIVFYKELPVYGMVDAVTFQFDVSGQHTIEVSLSNCVDLTDLVYDNSSALFGTIPFRIPTDWGTPELIQIGEAQNLYRQLVGTTYNVGDSGIKGGTLFTMSVLQQLLRTKKYDNLSMMDALVINRRRGIDTGTYNDLLGNRSGEDMWLTMWPKLQMTDNMLTQVKYVWYEWLKEALVQNEKVLASYSRTHKGGRSIHYNERDPFGSRINTTGKS